jgi:hypothetical protein
VSGFPVDPWGLYFVTDWRGYGTEDLREHAILTLRNLLEDNLDNQAVVQAIH